MNILTPVVVGLIVLAFNLILLLIKCECNQPDEPTEDDIEKAALSYGRGDPKKYRGFHEGVKWRNKYKNEEE